ncbi:adenylate/guanylate cyclase domain-containing protein [Rhizobium tubonense]|uniref:Adenylate/guanylate cyclase domain-containing protein n=1 Tax=Rhizobium tubonense TaxID=484088 RepID=A0A2W4EJN7_9HYPH|nr:adenylate/guanylate cyclase domain-containing protein [Rhizobium tubonense]PZM11210.1 adenylate/guanylate cyclase domain-containing protein [Rhizobium tubonense]
MECGACGNAIQSGFAFCPKCGARQPVVCAVCGQACQLEFAFCPRCGAAVGSSERRVSASAEAAAVAPEESKPGMSPLSGAEADRRPLTVLFADLCGFTTLSEKTDPETMRALQNELFEELARAVETYGGFVDKFVGDALLALFGAPTAHEDDPDRALKAAIEMISGAARVGARWEARAGMPLRLHVGINTGPVVTGGFGAAAARSYSVTGDTVNTAQRLQSMAGPDEILIGPLTHRLTKHAFSFESLGSHELRGKTASLMVYRLVGPLETPHTARGLESLGLHAPMIGRGTEMARLLSCLDLACNGSAQLVQLVGEAGIGKSRLANDFLDIVASDERFQRVVVRRATCSPLGEQSYGTLAAVLRSAYAIAERETAARTVELLTTGFRDLGFSDDEIGKLTPPIFYVFGLGETSDTLQFVEPEQLRRQILYATRTIIERRLSLSPLLLVVEDLHWADAASIEALRFMMDRLERSQLMMLTTCRSTSDGEGLDSSRTSRTVLRLPPLSTQEGQTLLSAFFDRAMPADICGRVLARAGGNPLFIEEIIRGLIETGVIQPSGGSWTVSGKDVGTEIPMSLQAMLLARVDRLPPSTKHLAQEAAVIGPRFEEALLRSVATEPSLVDTGIDFLCDTEILEEVTRLQPQSSTTYRFTQSLLHDVIYNNLLLQQREQMHGRVGRAIERGHHGMPERLEDIAQLGHHFCRAGESGKGAHYLMAAGDLAGRTYANEDAMRLYRAALSAVSDVTDAAPEQLALVERLADLHGRIGEREAARQHYGDALAIHEAAGDRLAAARILRKLGRLSLDAGRRDLADANYTQAFTLLSGSDAPIELAHLLQERGHLAFRMGDHNAAARWADEALGHLNAATSKANGVLAPEAAQAEAEALNTKGVALARLGRHREAVQEVEQSLKVAEDAGLMSAACRAYSNLGVLYTIIDPARAIEVCRRGLDLAMRIADLGFQARLFANLAVACCTFTDSCAKEGVPAAEKAVEIDRALDQRDHLAVPLIVLGQIYQCHGRPALALKYYGEALALALEIDEPQLLFPCYDGLATLNLEQNDLAEAERFFCLAEDICRRHGLDPGALVVLPFLD